MKIIVLPFIVLFLFLFVRCEEETETYYLEEYEHYVPCKGGEHLHCLVHGSEGLY